jgi:hypothetical protein
MRLNFRSLKAVVILPMTLLVTGALLTGAYISFQVDLKGKYAYKDFESARKCGSCHPGIYEQWKQSMMSQAYTHHWDEIEYFDLAVAHAEADPSFKDAVDGCNGCHAPLAWMAGVLPPARPEANSMANESVSCEVCHLMQHSQTDPPYNFSYFIEPGETKYTSHDRGIKSPAHKIEENLSSRQPSFAVSVIMRRIHSVCGSRVLSWSGKRDHMPLRE